MCFYSSLLREILRHTQDFATLEIVHILFMEMFTSGEQLTQSHGSVGLQMFHFLFYEQISPSTFS